MRETASSFLRPWACARLRAELNGLSGLEKEVLQCASPSPTSDFPSVRGAVTFP